MLDLLLDKPNRVGFPDLCIPWLCVSLLVSPYPPWNHVELGGGSVAERSMRELAYGWVEHCSDVAGCRTRFPEDKYSCA